MPVFRTVKDAKSGSVRLEAVHQPLYDSVQVSASGTTNLFAQGPAGRSKLYTNMTQAGALTWPKRFSVRALRQVLEVGVASFADQAAFLSRALYTFAVGEKNYLVVPAFCLTAGTGLEAQTLVGATLGTANIKANLGRPEQRNLYGLIHSIFIPPVQNFGVTLEIASGYTAGAAFYLWLFLEGELLREIQ